MDKEFLLTKLARNMKENLYKVYTTDLEPTHGLMEKNMLENIKMMNFMGKESLYFRKTQVMRTN